MLGADDEAVLAWAAQANRILVTHDISTMTDFAYQRIKAGLLMPGLIEVPEALSIGRAIQDLTLLILCSRDGEWESQAVYLPL